jgi:enoyl-CoA hydratase/carnithine racemase
MTAQRAGVTGSGVVARAPAGQDPVRIERPEAGIALLTLNRPQRRNSLSIDMLAALHGAVSRLGMDRDVSAIVIAAEGPAFCAGHDLKELTAHRSDADGGRAFFAETMTRCAELMKAIVACPKPVIAAAHATATAAGCQLVATCDLAVADEGAKFATPGVNIGLFCSTPMVALSRTLPRKRAMEMLLLGEMIGSGEAAEYGLVNRVVPAGRAREEAVDMARIIASKSTITVGIGKKAFYEQIEKPLGEAYDYAAKVMVENMLKADAAEGIGAFLEKRPPVWKGC